MEVKPGYKQTEVGVIPEDWDVQQLGELKPFVTSGSRGWASYYSERGDLFVRITNLTRESIYLDLKDSRFVRLPEGDSEGVRTQLKENDVLISITADIGIIGYADSHVPTPAYINQHIALLRFDPAKVNSKFVSYFLASEESQKVFRAATDTGAKAGMSLSGVQKIQTALPPTTDEQRAIATALSDMDALLDGLDRLIAKKRAIKQATMQQLLTGQTRLPGFSGEWEEKCLGDCLLATPDYGINAPAVIYSAALPTYIRITDINDDGRFMPSPKVSVNSPFSNDYLLQDGDIVFARTGASVGKSYRYRLEDGPLVFAGFLIRVRPNPEKLAPSFLAAFVTSKPYWSWVRLMSMRSGQPGINGNEYASLPLRFPSIEEQTDIAAVLTDMDTEITALETCRTKSRALKQAMMQELLTGRTRLV